MSLIIFLLLLPDCRSLAPAWHSTKHSNMHGQLAAVKHHGDVSVLHPLCTYLPRCERHYEGKGGGEGENHSALTLGRCCAPCSSSTLATYHVYTEEQLPKPQHFLSTLLPSAPAAQSPHSAPARAAGCLYSVISEVHNAFFWQQKEYLINAVSGGWTLLVSGWQGSCHILFVWLQLPQDPGILVLQTFEVDVGMEWSTWALLQHCDHFCDRQLQTAVFTPMMLLLPLWICRLFYTCYFYQALSESGFSYKSKHSFQCGNTTPITISNCCKVPNHPSSSCNKKKMTQKCKNITLNQC